MMRLPHRPAAVQLGFTCAYALRYLGLPERPGADEMTRTRQFEATTYLKAAHPEAIPELARKLNALARERARGRKDLAVIEVRPAPSISSVIISLEVSSEAPSGAARIAGEFLAQVLKSMHEGNVLEIASRELAYA